jgi:chain length determinant protein EpsF
MNLQHFFVILRARYRVILLVFLTTVSVIVAASLLMAKRYTATASVVVDVNSPDPIVGALLPSMITPAYMGTQVDVINSKRVAQRVVKLLKLDESPQVRQNWIKATDGKGKLDDWLAAALLKSVEVKPSRESNVIDISYKAGDPAFAAAVANAFTTAYLDASTELRAQSGRQYADWFGERARSLRDELEKAQARVSEYQQRHGIVTNDERLDDETTKLNQLSAQLPVLQALNYDARVKSRSGTLSETLPEVTQNPLIINLKGQIAVLESKLHELSGELGTNHPQYRDQELELARLQQKLKAETAQIVSGFSTLSSVNKDKEAELRAAIEAQKRKLIDIKRERGELAVLMRDVDAAQKAYDAVAQRFNQSSLESHSTQSNIAVLSPATEPAEPSFPKLLLNIAISIFLGTMFGVGAAFVLEIIDRRIRSADDLSAMLGLSVVGVIPRTKTFALRKGTYRLGLRRVPTLIAAP